MNTSCLTIEAAGEDRHFTRDFVYLKLETVAGCQALLKVVFPKQDILDAKTRKALAERQGKGGQLTAQKMNKAKRSKDIEYQIAKLITEPRLYVNFCEELKTLKDQKMLRQSSLRKNDQTVDHVNKNVEIARNIQEYQHQKQEKQQ